MGTEHHGCLQPLSHLPALSSAGGMDNIYEVESPGICAVALYDYQGGGSAMRVVRKVVTLARGGAWELSRGWEVVAHISCGGRVWARFKCLPCGR